MCRKLKRIVRRGCLKIEDSQEENIKLTKAYCLMEPQRLLGKLSGLLEKEILMKYQIVLVQISCIDKEIVFVKSLRL